MAQPANFLYLAIDKMTVRGYTGFRMTMQS